MQKNIMLNWAQVRKLDRYYSQRVSMSLDWGLLVAFM